MKKNLLRIALVLPLIALFVLPLATSAISYIDPSGDIGLGTADLQSTVINVINYVLGLLGIIAVIMVLWGGYTWLTAGGNEDKVKKAKDIISAAVIGIVVILLAWAIVNFVINTGTEVTTGA